MQFKRLTLGKRDGSSELVQLVSANGREIVRQDRWQHILDAWVVRVSGRDHVYKFCVKFTEEIENTTCRRIRAFC